MKREVLVRVSRNEIIGRLEKLAKDMQERNDHDEAFIVGIAIQVLRDDGQINVVYGGGGGGRAGGI